MSDQLHDRVPGLLSEARTELDSLPADGDADTGERGTAASENDRLAELAGEADEILEENESGTLLEAVGLGTLPDGSEAGSIPEAIAKGDAESVGRLRSLLRLADLSDPGETEPSALGETVETLRDSLEVAGIEAADESEEAAGETSEGNGAEESEGAASESGGEEERESESDDETEGESEGMIDRVEDAVTSATEGDDTDGDETEGEDESEDEGVIDRVEGAVASAADGDESDGEAESVDGDESDEGGLEDELRSAFGNALGGFRDDVDEVRNQLEEHRTAAGSDQAEGEPDSAADEPTAEDAEGEPAAAEPDDRAESEDDDRSGGFGSQSQSHGSMYSTVAPSPSDRADMRSPSRHSTMPRRR